MTFAVLIRDYVVLALWGWPGLAVGILIGLEVLERVFRRHVICSTRVKLWLAVGILAAGLFTNWRDLSLPNPVVLGDLHDQLDEQRLNAMERREREEREARSPQVLAAQVEALRRELAKEPKH